MSARLTVRAWPSGGGRRVARVWQDGCGVWTAHRAGRAPVGVGARIWVCALPLALTGAILAGTVTPAHAAPLSGSPAPAPAPVSAPAPVPAKIAASFHPDRLGAMGAFTVTLDLAGGLGDPPPLRRAVLRLPVGLGIEVPHLRSCDPERLRRLGARGCPAQSTLGSGRASVRALLGSQLLGENLSLGVFLGPLRNLQPTFEMLAQGYTPFDERVVLSGAVLPDNPPYGEDLVLSVPAIPTLPLEPNASVVSMSLTIGSDRRLARDPNAAIEPAHCPPGGFPFAAELTYAEGQAQEAFTTIPCP